MSLDLDIEEQLAIFTVRSNKQNLEELPTTSRNYKNEFDLIPLLVKDIHKLTLPDKCFAQTITAYGFPFSSVLIYGRITSTGAGANGIPRYCLDDGTGLINVRLLKRKGLKDIEKLSVQCFRTFGNNKELYDSVQRILKTTRKQLLDIGQLPYGTKALLIGRPYRCFDEAVFSAFELIVDNGVRRDLEIAVKDFLIDWYATRFRARNLTDPASSHFE